MSVSASAVPTGSTPSQSSRRPLRRRRQRWQVYRRGARTRALIPVNAPRKTRAVRRERGACVAVHRRIAPAREDVNGALARSDAVRTDGERATAQRNMPAKDVPVARLWRRKLLSPCPRPGGAARVHVHRTREGRRWIAIERADYQLRRTRRSVQCAGHAE
eukprot:6736086-Prymnesium_polylepis.1